MYFGTGVRCQLYMCVFPFVQGSEFMLKEGVTEQRWRVSPSEWSSWRDEARIPAGAFMAWGIRASAEFVDFCPLKLFLSVCFM